ncbi:peroxisomal membrane protein 11A-like [Styela clava]
MDDFLAFCNKTAGRDKLYRVTQYGSKFLVWYLLRNGNKENAVNMLIELEKLMSTSRKLFRFGKSVDSLRAAQRAINLQNYVLSLTLTTSHTNKAAYLLIDHYIWMGKVGLVHADLKKWTESANKFWLASLMMAFARDLYSLYINMQLLARDARRREESISFQTYFSNFVKQNQQAIIDLLKNGFDIVIPANSLGYTNFNNGVVGLCGVLSSLLAAVQIAKPSMKLTPN